MRQIKNSDSYRKDFYKWALTQADLLKKRDFTKIDLEHIIEEIEDLGKSERNALKSYIAILLMHLLKIKYQPQKKTKSWTKSIDNARIEIEDIIKENPSLKRELDSILIDAYSTARKKARVETGLDIKTFPEQCPWNLEEVLGSDD